jgi:putative ABC transport system substrate-binding protein
MSGRGLLRKRVRIITFAAFLVVLSGLLLVSCNTKPEPYRIGILSGLDFVASAAEGFKAEMTELGYAEGEDIVYDVQNTDFDIPTYQNVLNQFVEDEVDLIVVFPTEASIEAKNATAGTDIPVVFSVALVEGMGLVDSVREPGGNITGVRYPGPEIAVRRFEILRQIVPDKTQFIIPYQKGYPIVPPQLEILRPAAAEAGITLIEIPASNAEELAVLLQDLSETEDLENSAILMLSEPLTVTADPFAVLADFASEHQLPMGGAIYPTEGYGSMFDVNIDIEEAGRLAAPQADKILKGTNAGTIPVISSDMTLVINNKQAEELGLVVPQDLLLIADDVIR